MLTLAHCQPPAAAPLRDVRSTRLTVRGSGAGAPPSTHPLFTDEPPPRWAAIGPDESVAIVLRISPTRGPITSEMARGATLRVGELVLVRVNDDAWPGIVRRVSTHVGALVEELLLCP